MERVVDDIDVRGHQGKALESRRTRISLRELRGGSEARLGDQLSRLDDVSCAVGAEVIGGELHSEAVQKYPSPCDLCEQVGTTSKRRGNAGFRQSRVCLVFRELAAVLQDLREP